MNTLLDKMNDEETNNATLFKRKAVAFIKKFSRKRAKLILLTQYPLQLISTIFT